jgi:hypothetical protein
MGRPKDGYFIDGEKVPGVTSVLSRFKESGALMYWAWQQGKEGKDFRETKQAAADAGTVAHDMVEHDIYGQRFDESGIDPSILSAARGAYDAYKEWKDQTHLQVAEAEVSLLSRIHRFGGTLDALFIRGKLALGDWKTSNGVYADYLLQLGAYQILWEENYPERPITGGFHLLRFSKQQNADDPIAFTHHYWSQLDVAKQQFLLLLEAHKLDKRIKALAK